MVVSEELREDASDHGIIDPLPGPFKTRRPRPRPRVQLAR